MNAVLLVHQAIKDEVVALAQTHDSQRLTDNIILKAYAATLIGCSGVEYLRLAEQALRSCGRRSEAGVIRARYRAEISAARDD